MVYHINILMFMQVDPKNSFYCKFVKSLIMSLEFLLIILIEACLSNLLLFVYSATEVIIIFLFICYNCSLNVSSFTNLGILDKPDGDD
jgi:hypothetical protein